MTPGTTTGSTLGLFTFSCNAKIKIILQLKDACARVCTIWHFTAYNSVHTEKWKPKTNPRYITFPKHAWQDTLHVDEHNAIYKLIVDFTQRIQYMQYSTGNTYLVGEVMYFSLNFRSADVDCLPHRLPPNISVLPVFVLHVPAVSNLRGRLKQTYVLHGLIFRTKFLLRRVSRSARSYTDFPGLVQVAAEKERGLDYTDKRKCSRAGRPKVTVTLEIESRRRFTWESPLQRSTGGRTRSLLTLVTPP